MRQEQLAEICAIKPPYAIIAGGRPSQARELESLGIATYLHVPSPGLLRGFLKDGMRRFVFEGSECGGHTGPRTSLILWETAIDILAHAEIDDPGSVQIMFAGGIHDALSAAMVAVLAAPLLARGMKIGILMGTAYLFTDEIVASGAIVEEFQQQAIACQETSLLQSGVGIYTRCAKTAFCDEFENVRRELIRSSKSEDDILMALELMNIGRLRIAAKGITRNTARHAGADTPRYSEVDRATQRREGIYMLGDVARLRHATCSINALHAAVSEGSTDLLAARRKTAPAAPRKRPEALAIVGMAGLFPGAQGLRQYWQNILRGVDAIREVDEARWRPRDLFDPKRGTADKVYSKWGGFLDDIAFDPQAYGIAPASLASIEPAQLLALEVARRALADAGFDQKPFARERTASIFAVGGMNDLGTFYNFRTLLPHFLARLNGVPEQVRQDIIDALYRQHLPVWTEDTFPGILGNVVAGRIANRLDLGGTNFTVDAACAASLAALDVGIKQLRNGDADVALVGGVDCTNSPIGFMCFSQTHALSPRGRSRPFDRSADGIAISEAVGAVVLKRLTDAERDGDRIYALIRGIGSSSDGRNRSLTAPHPPGQLKALQRAYEDAGIDPGSVTLIEAHGTGTALGDKSEIESLRLAFGTAARRQCAIGSVKSMIGHSKIAAGIAGLIKAALALQHQVLPPTIGVNKPIDALTTAQSAFYVNSESRPWLHEGRDHPRYCGVSAFGFGGTNFHAVLEEYVDSYRAGDKCNLNPREVEIFAFGAGSRGELEAALRQLLARLDPGDKADGEPQPAPVELGQLAYSLYLQQNSAQAANTVQPCRLTIVADALDDLRQKLIQALSLLAGQAGFSRPPSLYYGEGTADNAKICFLFPGQGSQKINMLRDLVRDMPDLHRFFAPVDGSDAVAGTPLAQLIYPLPAFGETERNAQQQALNATAVAQPALGMAGMAAFEVLSRFGLHPDLLAGHSYGEYIALYAAGVLDRMSLLRLSIVRGRLSGTAPDGAMAAVDADGERVAEAIARHGLTVGIANLNGPAQTIIAGARQSIDAALAALSADGLHVRLLPVGAAFHCGMMDAVGQELAAELDQISFAAPRIPVYANTTAKMYPSAPQEIRALLARHIAEPVHFVEQIEALYEAGARTFIECGPGLVLSRLVDNILGARPHLTLAIDAPGRPGFVQLAQLLAQARASGLPLNLAPWFTGRGFDDCEPDAAFETAARLARPGALSWRVNGGRATPSYRMPQAQTPASAPSSTQSSAPSPTQSSAPSGQMPAADLAEARQPAPSGQPRPPLKAVTAMAPNDPIAPSVPIEPTEANPSPQKKLLPHTRYRSNAMTIKQKIPDAALEAAPDDSQFAQIQHGVSRLLDLQFEQQLSLRHFLDFQARLAGLSRDGLPHAALAPSLVLSNDTVQPSSAAPAPSQQKIPPQQLSPSQQMPPSQPYSQPFAPPQAIAVPRAPVLPLAVLNPSPGAASSPFASPPAIESEPVIHLHKQAIQAGQSVQAASTADFKTALLQAAAERTGYPADMLDLEAHMEADLGIDSIKRIEIFSSLTAQYRLLGERDEETVIEELSGLKTLNEIIAWYEHISHAERATTGAASGMERNTEQNTGRRTEQNTEQNTERSTERNTEHNAVSASEANGGTLPKKVPTPPSPRNEKVESDTMASATAQSGTAPSAAPMPCAPAEQERLSDTEEADIAAAEGDDPVLCYVVQACAAPLAGDAAGAGWSTRHPVWLLGAASPLARAMSRALTAHGHTVIQLIPGDSSRMLDERSYEIDFSSPESVQRLVRLCAGPEPVGALINLMAAGDDASQDRQHNGDARALFLLLKLCEADLKKSAKCGAGLLINVSAFDGQFGLGKSRPYAVGGAGTLGLAKSAAREWPGVRVKCIDIAPDLDADMQAARVLAEICSGDPAIEIGLTAKGRWRIDLQPDSTARRQLTQLTLEAGAVLLITGGAYGITAELTRALAEKYPLRLVLAGRSPLPAEEDALTAAFADTAQLKQFLIADLRQSAPGVTPAKVDLVLKRILKERQIRANLAAMRATGAEVDYRCIDVRDAAAFGQLIDDIYARWGRIDGVLHGAGIIGDKLIGEKSLDAFDAVYNTKVIPAMILADKLRPETLRFIAFFSSVAGRFGNAGQGDYSAANEVLNKLAGRLSRLWPHVHSVAINWGPWDAGMVSDELRRQYAAHAIRPIPAPVGRRHFIRQLERGASGEAELVISSSVQKISSLQRGR